MLIGFTIVAAPLLFAIVNAAVQMNHLSTRSEELVLHGVRGTRNNQRMFEEIGALERTARLYQIVGSADLLDVYARNQQRLSATLTELLAMPLDTESHSDAVALAAEADRLQQELKQSAPTSARMADLVNAFPELSDMASKVSNRVSAQIDRELNGLQLATQLAQRNLFWETLLLVPMTLAVVGVFTYLFGRPIRAIDRAISELGRGTFSRPINIRGPADLERFADPPISSAWRLNWNGCAAVFWIWRRKRTVFCDICRMNSRRRSQIYARGPNS